MKITAKTTKQELKDFLGANVKAVSKKDKNLYERLAYADAMLKKDEKQVTRRDLAELAKEVIRVLGNKVVTPVLAEETPVKEETPVEVKAENSVKKASKGVDKVKKAQEETPQEETPAKAEKPAKKSLGKKKETPKKDDVTVLDGAENKKAVQLAKQFPETFEADGTKCEIAHDIETMEDLYNAMENEESIVFAFYWTKRHLKQFPYFNGLLGQPKEFEHDLDLCSCIYVSDKQTVAYNVSMYTDAVYAVIPSDLKEEDGIRFASGIEFQIYRIVDEEEAE